MPAVSTSNMCLDSAMDNYPTYRILNDYGLHRMFIHTKEHYSFMTCKRMGITSSSRTDFNYKILWTYVFFYITQSGKKLNCSMF